MKRRELISKRTANTKIFENADHSMTAEIYLDAVHFQEEDGSWKDMDDTLQEESAEEDTSLTGGPGDKEKELINKKGKLQIRFAKHAKEQGTVTVKKNGAVLHWGVKDAAKADAVPDGVNGILYSGVLEGMDVRCRVLGEKVKEDLILTGPETSGTVTVLYRMKKLEAIQVKNHVSFVDGQGEEIFVVYAPYMKDAAGVKSEEISLTLVQDGKDCCRILFQADEEWLKSPERKYPVVIDPVTTTSKKASDIMDAHVDSLLEEDNFQQSIILKTKGGDNIQRSFLKFVLPTIKTGDMVVNAKLVLVSLAEDNKERTVNVHRVMQDWNSATINWNNKPVYDETIEDSCKFKGDKQKYITLDVTRLVKDWYQNGHNFGLMFKDDYEMSGYTEFLASDCDSGYQDMRPRIDISYVNYSGLEDFWNYHSQDVGRAGTVHVNDYNGNLILVRPDLEMGGSRIPVSLKHAYNSNNRTENIGYGYGFRLNYHQTLEKVKIADTDYYKHTDGDGTVHYFYYDSDKKKWKDESGMEFTLIVNTGSSEPYVIRDKEDNQMVFGSSGYLVKIRDKNSNVLSITYSSSRITKITDGAGRVTTLTYFKDSSGNPTDLSQVKAPSGQTVSFGYTDHNLTSITDIDGQKITYTFTSGRNLSSLANVDGYQVKYSYYSTSPYRVKKIAEYGGSTAGNSLTLSYGYNSTKFTDNKGRAEIFRFNNSGNLIHIHDGFGHAASGKYNKDGNHVNRLENETKLQDNIVQLLKDPVIQAGTIGWAAKVYAEGTGSTSINTDTKYCMVGTRSLKAVCTSESSYAYWAQNVTVKKGETYTASMYVRAEVTSAASDGGCLLRVRYLDKDGVQHLLDSEILKTTTTDFVRLKNTFTLPADASSDSIKIYMVVWHAVGTMYGDMAQLETGGTANRCNLVDNGEFHRGSTSGFSKTGYPEDGLTTVGADCYVPMQVAMVTKASAAMYQTPSASGTQVATVAKGQHLTSSAAYKDSSGKIWYRVKNASGQWGYISSGSVVPYLGGSTCNHTAAAGVTGAVLRASASDTGTPVEELIPKGTSLSIVSSTTDANGKKWYYLGMQIDTSRYYGYLPTDSVIRLYRNYVTGKMTAADNYYLKPSKTSTVMGSAASGATVVLRGILEKSNGEKWYAVLKGTEFVFLPQTNITLNMTGYVGKINSAKVTETVGGLEEHIYKFLGDPAANKKLTKTLDLQGKKGDTYMVNAWGRGTPLPETSNDTARRFGVEVVFVGTDGTNDTHYTNFSPDILDWQFLSDVYVAKKDYSSIKVSYTYCHNANIAFFDGLSLFREEFGQSYTYDADNNVISVVDAKKQASKFEYNSTNDMTGITDAKGNKFTYAYDSRHNVTKGTSAQGLVYKLEYDSAGNVTKSGCAEPDNQSAGTWMTRAMTASKNHVASVTDARNCTVKYAWDENKDILSSVTDARGGRLAYSYDSANRLAGVLQEVTQDGTKKTVSNTYGYTKDRLTAISHNGFSYGFAYDAFGNVLNASVAGARIVDYEYEANNGNLKKVTYANGDSIRYTYDAQDRMLLSYYKSASGAEQKLNGYVYDRAGNLAQVTNYPSGKSYDLDYDFLDRLMRARDNDGNYYEYTYDENNNLTRMYHGAGTSGIATSYTYDKDGREVTAKASGNYYRTTSYDSLGRVDMQTWTNTGTPHTVIYEYNSTDSTRRSSLPSAMILGSRNLGYTYDGNGNITRIQDSDTNASGGTTKSISYQYDELNRLTREDNQVLNKTVAYSYDLGGNLVSEKEYAYTTGTLPAAAAVTKTGTYDTVWKDKLLNWNGTAMTYDAIGNMLTKGSTTYTWTQGRKLASVQNGKSIQYFYDHTGNRTRKVVDGVTTQFRYAGDLLVSERTGSEKNLWYRYDSAGNVISVTYDSVFYTYVRNVQNDVIAMIDSKGNEVVRYTYDSWGRVMSITGSMSETLGKKNPFRYRGYYYDTETGLYYLKNRYYDPEIRRFISADDTGIVVVSPRLLKEKNLYLYCDNNPVARVDIEGHFWITAALVGFATSTVGKMIIGAAVGAVINIGSCWIAAKVTGQKFDYDDGIAAGINGALSGINPYVGGIASGACAYYMTKKDGGNIGEIVASTSAAFVGTTCMGNLGSIIGGKSLNIGISAIYSATFGTGGNLVAAGVNAGISQRNKIGYDKTLHIYKKSAGRFIGYGASYNGKTGVRTRYKIYLSEAGFTYKVYI